MVILKDNFFGKQIRDACNTKLLIHKIPCHQGTKLLKFTCIFMSFTWIFYKRLIWCCQMYQNYSTAFFNTSYRYISFVLKSLITDVAIQITVKIIRNRIYSLEQTNFYIFKETGFEKADTCTKTVFIFKNIIYEQMMMSMWAYHWACVG